MQLVEAGPSWKGLTLSVSEQSSRTMPKASLAPWQHHGPHHATTRWPSWTYFGARRPQAKLPPNHHVPDLPLYIRGGWILEGGQFETDHFYPHQKTRALHREQSHPERSTESSFPTSIVFLLSDKGEISLAMRPLWSVTPWSPTKSLSYTLL
jgi:hypothetical protein